MIRVRTEMRIAGANTSMRGAIRALRQAGVVSRLMPMLAAMMMVAFTPSSAAAWAKKPPLPYVTIDHPQFISASQARFLFPKDLLIGVSDGKTAKAYPAAILAQHGVVQDRMADGPIAVTW